MCSLNNNKLDDSFFLFFFFHRYPSLFTWSSSSKGLLVGEQAQGHFQIGPAEKHTGSTLSAGEVRPAGVIDRTGHPQGTGPLVLAKQCLPSAKGTGHIQLHHPLIRCQLVQRTKVTASQVRTADVLCPSLLATNCSHRPFRHNPHEAISSRRLIVESHEESHCVLDFDE